jgi:hypothetical protein
MQVMRTRPDIEKDQRPEMDDRQAIGVDWPSGTLGHEIVHDGKEARSQEETDGIVPIPPLHHRILHTGPDDEGLRRVN